MRLALARQRCCRQLMHFRPHANDELADVMRRNLPGRLAEFGAKSSARFFLKYILSHPAVTCVIPGADKPKYMIDNLAAGRGAFPNTAQRKRKEWCGSGSRYSRINRSAGALPPAEQDAEY